MRAILLLLLGFHPFVCSGWLGRLSTGKIFPPRLRVPPFRTSGTPPSCLTSSTAQGEDIDVVCCRLGIGVEHRDEPQVRKPLGLLWYESPRGQIGVCEVMARLSRCKKGDGLVELPKCQVVPACTATVTYNRRKYDRRERVVAVTDEREPQIRPLTPQSHSKEPWALPSGNARLVALTGVEHLCLRRPTLLGFAHDAF